MEPPRARLRRFARVAATLAFVGALVAGAHGPVLRAQALSLDDVWFVRDNPLVTHPGWASARRFFGEVLSPSTVKGYYLPLTMTSLMLDYAAGGRPDDLRAFHRTSLTLHVLNSALIVLLLYRLFGALVPAAIAGLLFGLHPLTVEPVAWVGERKTLLAACFALASLLCYVEHARGRGRLWMIASLSGFLLALLSKPTVTTLPVLLLVLDYWPLGRLDRRALVEKWPFFALALASGLVTLISHRHTAGIVMPDYARWSLQAGWLLSFYLAKIVRPTNLSCVYPQPVSFAVTSPIVLGSAIGAVALTLLLVRAARRAPGPLAGWAFFVLALAPTLGLVKYSWVIASDKYVYFPALGLLLIIASGLSAAWDAPRLRHAAARASVWMLVAVALGAEAHGVRTALRHWTDSLTLFRHMEQVAPESPVVHNELGILFEDRSAHAEAARELGRAVELAPNYPEAHYNLGIVLAVQGRLDESIRHFRTADELLPDDPRTVYNLGMALRLQGKLDAAEAQFRRALRLQPDHVEALRELGGTLVVEGRLAEAVGPLRQAAVLAPADALVQFRLASALVLLGGRNAEAVSHLRAAIRCAPAWPEPLNALAWLLATTPDTAVRDPGEALRLAGRAVELTGRRDPKVLDTLAAAQAAAGQFALALETARRALELIPPPGVDSLSRGIRDRMRLYRRGNGYTEGVPPGSEPAVPPLAR